MSRESTEELRRRLLGNLEVQNMIRIRAFEIYQRSGVQGRDAENWFQAEHEVLSFLIEEEDRLANEARRSSDTTAAGSEEPAITEQAGESSALKAEAQSASGSTQGAWSATQPASEEVAPPIGETVSPEISAPASKKSRSRGAAKSSATEKKKSGTSAKASTKSSTARRASSKESGEEGKPKKSRKQAKAEESA